GTAENLLANEATPSDDPTQEALSRIYLEDLQQAEQPNREVFRLSSMTRDARESIDGVTDVLSKDPPASSELSPPLPEPRSIVIAGLLMFVALAAVGGGWAIAAVDDRTRALALSPAFGAAALILAGVLLDRLGLRLDGPLVPISGLAVGLAGYFAAWLAAWLPNRKVESTTLPDATT
ncbi:MAG: hypothetical protein MUP92_03825, partial [Actinobacteria bacterium]|nr:hypothetical protein [Actinomycetota bacterium]